MRRIRALKCKHIYNFVKATLQPVNKWQEVLLVQEITVCRVLFESNSMTTTVTVRAEVHGQFVFQIDISCIQLACKQCTSTVVSRLDMSRFTAQKETQIDLFHFLFINTLTQQAYSQDKAAIPLNSCVEIFVNRMDHNKYIINKFCVLICRIFFFSFFLNKSYAKCLRWCHSFSHRSYYNN